MKSHSRLDYNPDTGVVTWVDGPKKGKPAGWKDDGGYVITRIDGYLHRNHHIAWFKMTGKWPTKSIDHINNNPSDNRWSNLREATMQQQGMNQKLQKRRKGKWKGVHETSSGKFMVKIKHNQKNVAGLGCRFTVAREAALVYNHKAKELFGAYATFNQVFEDEKEFRYGD